ncbi:hypothetical protein NBRC116597_44750 [Phaeobacter sp. NW0010-22]
MIDSNNEKNRPFEFSRIGGRRPGFDDPNGPVWEYKNLPIKTELVSELESAKNAESLCRKMMELG